MRYKIPVWLFILTIVLSIRGNIVWAEEFTTESTVVTAVDCSYTYDGDAHGFTMDVSGPEEYSVYYSSSQLTAENYTDGSTTAPTRTFCGTSVIYYYVDPADDAFEPASGSLKINILPYVSVKAYSQTVDGSTHTITTAIEGNAYLYYSTSTPLNFSNYAYDGSVTVPERSAPGVTTVYWIAVPDADAAPESCRTGVSSITLLNQTQVTAEDGYYLYDGSAHGISLTVIGPADYTVYYASYSLTAKTCTNGSTTAPTRTDCGLSRIYYYVQPADSLYAAASGYVMLYVRPDVTVSSYTGTVDGAAHTITVSAKGTNVIYYGTSEPLTCSNYVNKGSTTRPTRSIAGTTTVYWIALPAADEDRVQGACTSGSAQIILAEEDTDQEPENETTVVCPDVKAAYDGKSHGLSMKVTGPLSYQVYYSTSPLDAENYTEGSTALPVRTALGISKIYYYVKSQNSSWTSVAGSASIQIDPAKVQLVSAVKGCGYIKLTWTAQTGVNGYRIYRKVGSSGWSYLASVSGAGTSSYTDTKDLISGTKYTYTVRAFYGSQLGSFDTAGKAVNYTVTLTTPALTSLTPATGSLTLRWKKVTGAAGYYIYRKAGSTASWSRVKTITSGSTVSWSDTSMTNGTKYIYTVRAYNGNVLSSFDKTGLMYYYLARPSYVKLASTVKGRLAVAWAKNTKVSGIQFYYSLSSTFASDTRAKTIAGTSKTSWAITNLPGGSKYYVKARYYYTIGGKTYFSSWSPVASVTIHK